MVIIYHPQFGVGHLVNKENPRILALRVKDSTIEKHMVVASFPNHPSKEESMLVDIKKAFELDWTTMFRREPE